MYSKRPHISWYIFSSIGFVILIAVGVLAT